MVEVESHQEKRSEGSQDRLLIFLGLLWLVLAGAIIFTQFSRPTPIQIEWKTETEINTAGFNVYRGPSESGPFTQINEQLIPSEGSAVSGASYHFVDENVSPGETYYYQLEDVELDNSAQTHEPIAETAHLAPVWAPIAAAISVIAGLVLLVKGLRWEKSR
ncbi:MAG TPA: hypothetical protein VK879_10785 [Candidatus Sulfomarinibacteraceae bacterium]|nr:hypothetical protein [Candidatus Sulfomarinibacteraceae bacterium]